MAFGQILTAEDGTEMPAIPFFLGVAYQVFTLAVTGIGLASTIQAASKTKKRQKAFCVVSTALSPQSLVLVASRGFLGVTANAWDSSGLESIALDVFLKRGVEGPETFAQTAHNHFVHKALSDLAHDGDVEMLCENLYIKVSDVNTALYPEMVMIWDDQLYSF